MPKWEYKEGNIPENEYKAIEMVMKRGVVINLADFKESNEFGIIRN